MKKVGWIGAGVVVALIIGAGLWVTRGTKVTDTETQEVTTETTEHLLVLPALTEAENDDPIAEEEVEVMESEAQEITIESSTPADSSTDGVGSVEMNQEETTKQTLLAMNTQFFSAYYGQGTIAERNQQLAAVLSDELKEQYVLPETGSVQVEDYSLFPYVGTITETSGEILTIVEIVFSTFPSKMVVTTTYEFDEEWQITEIDFELIQQ